MIKKGRTTLVSRAIIAVVAVVLVAGWYVGVYQHLSANVSAESTAVTAQRAQLASERLQLIELNRDKDDKGQLAKETSALSAALPKQFSLANFLADLTAAAAKEGVVLTGVTPTTPGTGAATASSVTATAPSGLQAVSFGLTATGDYHNIVSFLTALDGFPELMQIDTLGLQAETASGGSSSSKISATLTGRVFCRQGGLS